MTFEEYLASQGFQQTLDEQGNPAGRWLRQVGEDIQAFDTADLQAMYGSAFRATSATESERAEAPPWAFENGVYVGYDQEPATILWQRMTPEQRARVAQMPGARDGLNAAAPRAADTTNIEDAIATIPWYSQWSDLQRSNAAAHYAEDSSLSNYMLPILATMAIPGGLAALGSMGALSGIGIEAALAPEAAFAATALPESYWNMTAAAPSGTITDVAPGVLAEAPLPATTGPYGGYPMPPPSPAIANASALNPATYVNSLTGNAVGDAAVSGALRGAVTSAITGGNPLMGAATGGALSGAGSLIGTTVPSVTGIPVADQALASAGMGALNTGLRGGDPLAGAEAAGTGALVNAAGNAALNFGRDVIATPYVTSQIEGTPLTDNPSPVIDLRQTPELSTNAVTGGNMPDYSQLIDSLYSIDVPDYADTSQWLNPQSTAGVPGASYFGDQVIDLSNSLFNTDGTLNTNNPNTVGLIQMGQTAGLSGQNLTDFVRSGGVMGSSAAGGGGVGTGSATPFPLGGVTGTAQGGQGGTSNLSGVSATASPYINFAPVIDLSRNAPLSDRERFGSDIFSLQNLARVLGIGAGVAGVASIADKGLGGGSTTTQTTSVPSPSAEELELIKLNAELARKQIASIDQLQPFQRQLLEASLADITQQQALSKAMGVAIPPEEQAALARAEFDRSKRLGPIQEQLLQKQLDIINRNGAATPEQEALIKAASDAAIESGTADINVQTKRGIGLISDELANARGLRMTDTPILREATLLTDRAGDQIANLVRNIRASEATAKLNYPLAVNQVQSNIGQSQQSIADAAKNFNDNLRQQAVLNRQSMLGQTSSTGIGLANTGNSSSALNALLSARLSGGTRTSDTTQGIGLSDIGRFAGGIGSLGRTINESGIFR